MKDDKFIECEEVCNIIDEKPYKSGSSKREPGDEGYTDKAKTNLYVEKLKGEGM